MENKQTLITDVGAQLLITHNALANVNYIFLLSCNTSHTNIAIAIVTLSKKYGKVQLISETGWQQ